MESEGWAGEGVELSSSEVGRLCVCVCTCMFIFQNDFTTTINYYTVDMFGCAALIRFVCLTLLASFLFPSHLSLKHVHVYIHVHVCKIVHVLYSVRVYNRWHRLTRLGVGGNTQSS